MNLKLINLILICLLSGGCSTRDSEIPDYNSSDSDSIPELSIESVGHILAYEADVNVRIKVIDKRIPDKLYLCYSKENDMPDTTGTKIDLLPRYMSGLLDVKLKYLYPNTSYYNRLYVKMGKEEGYSELTKFNTLVSNKDAWKKVSTFPNSNVWYMNGFKVGDDFYFHESSLRDKQEKGGTVIVRYTPSTGEWRKVTDFPGEERTNMIGYVISSKIYMGFGAGIDDEGKYIFYNDLWEYDPVKDVWRRMQDFPESDLAVMSIFVHNNKGYRISCEGMWNDAYMCVNVFDPVTNQWTKQADYTGRKVNNTLTLSLKGRVFVIGGYFVYEGEKVASNQLLEYDPEKDSWQRRANFPGIGRGNMGGFVIEGRIFAGFGYENMNGEKLFPVNDLWEYIPDLDIWIPRASPEVFSSLMMAYSCGYVGLINSELWVYDPEKDK